MKTVIGKDLMQVLRTLRNETQPIDGHTDPGAIEDCWNEVFDTIEAQQCEMERLSNILTGVMHSVDKWFDEIPDMDEVNRAAQAREIALREIETLQQMNLNKLAKEIHQNAVEHGWWEKERSFAEIIALCHSELSEALEEYRNNRPVLYYNCTQNPTLIQPCMYENACECELALTCYGECDYIDSKPEGIAIELADCIIRILDYCAYTGIDIDKAIQIKHEYNKTRPYRHGGKVITKRIVK